MTFLSDSREFVIVTEDPVTITDGLVVSKTACVEISAKIPEPFSTMFAKYMALGLIKVKVNKLKKKRDWIKV